MEKNSKYYLEKYRANMAPTYGPNVVITKGKGSRAWDVEGKEYVDLAGGIAVLGVGHCHPKVVEALQTQAGELWHLSNVFANIPAIELTDRLCTETFAEKVFMTNSGAEANEAALKLARRHSYNQFGDEKSEIISFENSFHGRTLFTVSVGGQEKYRTGFGPVPGNINYAEYNNLEDLKAKISSRTCAVIMEPVQGEGGIIEATEEFVKGVRALCDEHKALLIFDEIQTGFGRTGSLYAYQQLGVTPDILTSAKAMGGGFPIGAMLTTEEIAKSFTPGTHGSTYGGNALGAAVANAVMDIIHSPEVYEGVVKRHKIVKEWFSQLNGDLKIFSEFRGKGLLIGLALTSEWNGKAKEFQVASLEEGVMTLAAGPNVLRLAPSLIIEEEELKEGLKGYEKAIRKVVENSKA